ncbi:hypothetical protein N0V88_004557 [Collariella sp. IMI 366227]|nr:hypothetical protein N0V88_004557 [Collariella sp. IMI 366227]
MSSSPVILFQALSQTEQPSAATIEDIKKQNGFQRMFFGLKMEDPETAILVTEWSSREAAQHYHHHSPPTLNAQESATLGFAPAQNGWDTAFKASCTEVFTGYGAEEGFAANDNIELLRVKRKSVDLFHAQFKKL